MKKYITGTIEQGLFTGTTQVIETNEKDHWIKKPIIDLIMEEFVRTGGTLNIKFIESSITAEEVISSS